jgi:hypothetical protein
MTPKEKADYLIYRYSEQIYPLINELPKSTIKHHIFLLVYELMEETKLNETTERYKYWQKVFKEIEKF